MKLYMKQKVISWGDKFTVTDERGETLYTVEGEMLTIGHKLHLYNARHEEVAYIHQKVLSLLPRFFVVVDGREEAEIVKEISLLHPKYAVKGPDWEAKGDVLGHDYRIKAGDETIASVHWKWMAWGDTYEFDIPDPANEVLALAAVLTIDAVNADIRNAETAATTTAAVGTAAGTAAAKDSK